MGEKANTRIYSLMTTLSSALRIFKLGSDQFVKQCLIFKAHLYPSVAIEKSFERKRRDRYEVIHDILETCRQGARKTALMYKANLSFELAKRYIEDLLSRGIIIRRDEMYFLTVKGKLLLDKLKKYKEAKLILERLMEDLSKELD
jgi:predicted transcriptional regulator